MDQNSEVVSSNRRFIFDDSFYDNFGPREEDNTVNENPSDISIPKVEEESNNQEIDNYINIDNLNTTINNNDIDNTNVQISLPQYGNVEPVGDAISTMQETNSFNNPIVESNPEPVIPDTTPAVEETPVDLGIPTPTEINYNVEPKVETPTEEIVQNVNNDNVVVQRNEDINFNVSSGIDTKLEQQLINNNTEYKPQQFEFNPYPFGDEPKEKMVYRASRNRNINNNLPNNMASLPSGGAGIGPIMENVNTINNNYQQEVKQEDDWQPPFKPQPIIITEDINYYEQPEEVEVIKSTLIPELIEKEKQTGKLSIIARYGDDFCSHDYVTNPAIGRDREIKELGLILLTAEKSAILVGKPGIGKTSIVEGLAYRLQRNQVPDALKGYRVVSIKTTSLLGELPTGETRLQTLIDEIKELDKIILFIDEVHMLMGATNESSLDFANMFKESLGRGNIKMIGATTTEEYERYVLRDKAFVRRFQKVDVAEPTRDQTIEILMGTLPKLEKKANVKMKYTHYVQSEIMAFIVDITTEYKRVYGIGSRYPDICITLVNQAFSNCVFNNRKEVNILDIRHAIEHSKNIYPDVIRKELINFDKQFKELIDNEN